MKTLFTLIISLLMFVGCSKPSGEEQTTPTPAPSRPEFKKYADEDEIKIMSFNIRNASTETDSANNWDNRKEACIELIKDHKPTLIGLQEPRFTTQWLYFKEQLKDSYSAYGVSRLSGDETGNGECMGILYDKSLIKLVEAGTFWLSKTPDKPSKSWDSAYERSATWGIFKHIPSGKHLYYINTHLDNEGNEARIEGMKLISKYLEKYKDVYPLFLTGDFNVDSGNDAIDPIRSYMWNARIVAPPSLSDYDTTYNGFKENPKVKIIDHIYCSKTNKVVEYHTIDEKYGGVNFISDHYPIYAIIKL